MRTNSKLYWLRAVCLLLLMPGVANAALNVFACEPEWAALAKEIGGDNLTIYSATTAAQDPHRIQARPSLIAKTRRADLLVCTGAELEVGWLPVLLRKAGNAKVQPGQPGHFLAADYVPMREKPERIDRSLGDVHAEGNPHIHTDPKNILRVAEQLQKRLKQLDPDNAATYADNFTSFQQQWNTLIASWEQDASGLKEKAIVSHNTYWSYLHAWLGINQVATLEPVPGVPPASSHLVKVKKQIEQKDIAMITLTAYANDRPAEWLSNNTGIPVVSLPASADFQQEQTLEQWFDVLIDSLNRVLP